MEEEGFLRFFVVWGQKVRKDDGQFVEVMTEKSKDVKKRWSIVIGMERVLR